VLHSTTFTAQWARGSRPVLSVSTNIRLHGASSLRFPASHPGARFHIQRHPCLTRNEFRFFHLRLGAVNFFPPPLQPPETLASPRSWALSISHSETRRNFTSPASTPSRTRLLSSSSDDRNPLAHKISPAGFRGRLNPLRNVGILEDHRGFFFCPASSSSIVKRVHADGLFTTITRCLISPSRPAADRMRNLIALE